MGLQLHCSVQVLLALALYSASVLGDLRLPPGLLSISVQEGQQRLLQSEYKSDFFELSEHFVSQINPAFCGVATSVIMLNALHTPRPTQPLWVNNLNYAYYTQDNIFNNLTEGVEKKSLILEEGMSLQDIAGFMAAHEGVRTKYQYSTANVISLSDFRSSIISALSQPGVYVSVNFDRRVLGEVGGGHHSPLAAYDSESDSVLLMDVARFKYVSFWVRVHDLYMATVGTDGTAQLPRGLAFAFLNTSVITTFDSEHISSQDNGYVFLTSVPSDVEEVSCSNVGLVVGLSIAMLVVGLGVGVGGTWWYLRRRPAAYHTVGSVGPAALSNFLHKPVIWSTRSSDSFEDQEMRKVEMA